MDERIQQSGVTQEIQTPSSVPRKRHIILFILFGLVMLFVGLGGGYLLFGQQAKGNQNTPTTVNKVSSVVKQAKNEFSPNELVQSAFPNYEIDQGHTLSVSPDKNYIFFSYFIPENNDKDPVLKSAILNTKTKEIIAIPVFADPVSWSPDGKWVAYQDSWSKDVRGLWIINLRTKQQKRLISTVGYDATSFYKIQWLPDSDGLTFSRSVVWGNNYPPGMSMSQIKAEESQMGVWQVSIDGSNLKKIKEAPEER